MKNLSRKRGSLTETLLEVISMSKEIGKLSCGNIIRILRSDRGLSLRELANKTGVTASYLSKLENEIHTNMSLAIFSLICKALNANPNLFLDDQLQSMLVQPLEIRDFFLIQELYYEGKILTEEQKK